MCWGFECGDGWYDLIDQLCSTIQNYINNSSVSQAVVDQVKEKYGTLRFYISFASDGDPVEDNEGNRLISGMIWFAEDMSSRICETCGNPGKKKGLGWYYTACEQHTKEEDKDD